MGPHKRALQVCRFCRHNLHLFSSWFAKAAAHHADRTDFHMHFVSDGSSALYEITKLKTRNDDVMILQKIYLSCSSSPTEKLFPSIIERVLTDLTLHSSNILGSWWSGVNLWYVYASCSAGEFSPKHWRHWLQLCKLRKSSGICLKHSEFPQTKPCNQVKALSPIMARAKFIHSTI